MKATETYLESKNHYLILDGLRGVAAIMVVIFHVFETYGGGDRFAQIVNHGYLGVDFFFALSGFVVAYAYDDRWKQMTTWSFFKRRLIRLQPMVIMGMLIGAALFYTQASKIFPLISTTPVWKMLLVTLIGCTMIPVLPSMDIRGWQETHPLDGPAWTLFFEYIGNIFYALFIRRFGTKLLAFLVFLAACLTINYTVFGPRGDVVGGWCITPEQLNIGFTRLLYPFLAGMLLMRLGKKIRIPGAFWICSAALIILFTMPRFGGPQHLWMNGIYESICIILIFPLILSVGAGATLTGGFSTRFCAFLGAISFPLYIIHYPFIYLHVALVVNHKIPMAQGIAIGIGFMVLAIGIAYACLKLYDEPLRKRLTERFLKH